MKFHMSSVDEHTHSPLWLFNLELLSNAGGHVSCFTKHTIIMCVSEFPALLASLFVSYCLPGNEGPPHVINGHNYVIEEWSAVTTRCPSRSTNSVVLIAYSGVSARTKTRLAPAQSPRLSFLSLVNKDLMVYKPSNNRNTFRAN